MTRILVLEDDDRSRESLCRMLEKISDQITVDAAADLAGARLLLRSAVSFDLFLLDIHLMVTSIAGLEIEAYRRLHCYQYIVKPYIRAEIEEIVNKVLFHIRTGNTPSILVKKDGINYKISCSEIVYCKAIPRGVCLCLKEEQLNVPYLSIRQLLEQLPKEQFFQCHRMYVVNQDAVMYYDLVNQVIQVEGYEERIDIGVTYKADVKKRIGK